MNQCYKTIKKISCNIKKNEIKKKKIPTTNKNGAKEN